MQNNLINEIDNELISVAYASACVTNEELNEPDPDDETKLRGSASNTIIDE